MIDFHIGERDEHARYPVRLDGEIAGHFIEDLQSGCVTMHTSHPWLPRMDGEKFFSGHKASAAIVAVLGCDHKWSSGFSPKATEELRFCRNCGLWELREASGLGEWKPEWMPHC